MIRELEKMVANLTEELKGAKNKKYLVVSEREFDVSTAVKLTRVQERCKYAKLEATVAAKTLTINVSTLVLQPVTSVDHRK